MIALGFLAILLLYQPQDAYAADPTPPQMIVDAEAFPDADERSEVATFYALRNNQRVFDFSDKHAMERVHNLISTIENWISYHGLSKNDYRLKEMQTLASTAQNESKLELLLIASLLQLAHDLHGDNIDLDSLYTGWDLKRTDIDFAALLNATLPGGTLDAYFQQLAPNHTSYTALAGALQIYTEIAAKGGWRPIDPGPSLHPHESGKRVTQLRARLIAEGYTANSPDNRSEMFDDALVQALTTYQIRNGLAPDSSVGRKTLESLNIPVEERIEQIRANMERWRHIPDSFPPERYVSVNIPDFTVTVYENGERIYTGAIVDGRPDRPTPFISSQIVNAVINPLWHVPKSIAREDILPKLREDPQYLERQGVVIKGRVEDPSGTTIDWRTVTKKSFNYTLIQAAGKLNSLGQLKFNFPNPFDVYMHGTPHQEHFKKPQRDYSSGCVRLADPLQVGEILLKYNTDNGGWPQARISSQIETGDTKTILLAKPVPVYFLYWTVFTDQNQQLNFRKDIYGYDQLLTEELASEPPAP